MPKHFEGETIGETPKADWPKIYAECAKHRRFGLKVMSEVEHITEQQRRWYKGIAIPHMVRNDENGETAEWWDTEIKSQCGGLQYLKKEGIVMEVKLGNEVTRVTIGRLTTKGVGKRNMTAFIEEILAKSIHNGWGISPPDKELRSK